MTELKPCPFCNQFNVIPTVSFVIGFPTDKEYTYQIGMKCLECKANISFGTVTINKKSPIKPEKLAISKWNRRTSE